MSAWKDDDQRRLYYGCRYRQKSTKLKPYGRCKSPEETQARITEAEDWYDKNPKWKNRTRSEIGERSKRLSKQLRKRLSRK